MNRDLALSKVYHRHMSNVMQFFPLKTAKGLMEITENGLKGEKEYPSILLKNEKLVN